VLSLSRGTRGAGTPATRLLYRGSSRPGSAGNAAKRDRSRDNGSHAFASTLETSATANAGLDRRFESVALVANLATSALFVDPWRLRRSRRRSGRLRETLWALHRPMGCATPAPGSQAA
jgi:hypothetical protein